MSDHEKQFVFLPLNLLDGATNIRELLLSSFLNGNAEHLDTVIDQIHKQMPTKCGRWLPVLAGLRFVEVIEDSDAPATTTIPATPNVIIAICLLFFYCTINNSKCFNCFSSVQKICDDFCWECHQPKHMAWSCSTCIRSFHETAQASKSRHTKLMESWRCNECIAIEKDVQRTRAK